MMMLLLVTILLGGHFFVYFSLVRFFSIEAANIKITLAVTLFLLGVSFILSSILAHYSENTFTKGAYFVSNLWLAVGWNLSMALILSWAAIGGLKLFNVDFDYKYLALFSFFGAAILSGYGIWSAFHPQLKNITAEMKNLPEAWQGKKMIQLSDVHLGHIYDQHFLESVVAQVNAENPDIVVITGDLFDGMDGQLASLATPLNDIKAPQGIYFVTGNHETYLGVNNALAALQKTPVHILDNAVVNIDGMQILGMSYPARDEKINLAEAIKKVTNFQAEQPNILLYHNPAEAAHAREAGIDLQLAGHTHRGQLFPFQWITQLIYGKYAYGLTTEGDFSLYTSAGVGTWGPAMRTSGRPEILVIGFEGA